MRKFVGLACFAMLAATCSMGKEIQTLDPEARIVDAVRNCPTKGSIQLGSTISGFLGDAGSCSFVDSGGLFNADYYTVALTAGHTVQVTYVAAGWNGVATIQDFTSGAVLAVTPTVASSGLLTYVVQTDGTYLVGVGGYGTGSYTLRVADVTGPSSGDSLSLLSSRFRVTASYIANGKSGQGTAVAISGDTGYFWFFSPSAVEVVVKMVDGRALGGHFWVFAGGLTNVDVTITVTDTQAGQTRTYHNPQGAAFQPVQDTSAF